MTSKNEFKAGDKVVARRDGEGLTAGETYVVERVASWTPSGPWVHIVGKRSRASDGSYQERDFRSAWTPKVGERVRTLRQWGSHTKAGDFGTVTTVKPHGACVVIDDGDGFEWFYRHDELEPLPALRIEAGRYYRTRDGRKVGPVVAWRDLWEVSINGGSRLFEGDGRHRFGNRDIDLIALWEEPAAVAAPARVTTAATVDAINDEYGPVVPANDNGATSSAAKPKFKVGQTAVGKSGKLYRLVDNSANEYWPLRSEGNHYTAHFWKTDGRSWDGKSGHEDLVAVATAITPSASAIVALIEDGQPKPASRPYVHATTEAAQTEAQRLAGEHPGSKFGVYVLIGEPVKVDPPVYAYEWQRLAMDGYDGRASIELSKIVGVPRSGAHDMVMAWAKQATSSPHQRAA